MTFDKFIKDIEAKYSSIEDLSQLIKDDQVVVTAMAASEPQMFYDRAPLLLKDRIGVILYCANPSKNYDVFKNESFIDRLTVRAFFLSSVIKNHQKVPHVHYIPQHLSQWSQNLLSEHEVDVFWGSCSLPDPRGFVSLGPAVCYEAEVLKKAKTVVLEVNPNIPFTFGSTCVASDDVDYFVRSEFELPLYKDKIADRTDKDIAEYVADLVPDGATIQLGIGSIPNALSEALSGKKDLGVHTEMINDSIMRMYECGAITGRCKTIWPGKIIGAFAYGSSELYQFLDRNPMVELHPASIVNDPFRIGRNHKMTSINTAVEIDLTGQVCSESIGHRELSGVGGATDTHIGAQRSPEGKGIIALKSMTKEGFSKITGELKPGAKVSISRNDIDTVVTEYGVARLKGKSVAQRAKSLIAIAHPSVRDELKSLASSWGYI